MHIVFLTSLYPKPNLNGGGIGSFVQFLANELIKKSIKVSVVGINNNYDYEFTEENEIEIFRLPKSKWKFAKFYQHSKSILNKLKEINNKTKIDVLEGSELGFAFFPKKTSYTKLIRLHGGHHFFSKELGTKTSFWRSFQEKKSFQKADAYVAVSNYVGKKTKEYLKSNFNFKTIYNCIDTDKFSPNNNSNLTNTLLFVGTVCEKKGIRQLVLAMPIIKKVIPDIQLKIIGNDWVENHKSYKEYLKTFIFDDVKDNIEFLGQVSNALIPKYISESKICVYPSHMESFGLTWLEALSMGKPLVLGNVGPANELVINNKTAILVNPYNFNELAESVIKLLTNEDLTRNIGQNARKDILERFSYKSIVNQNIAFYKSLIKTQQI
ncbi:MAG: glycosyltransferase family 4 protein [Polaribacter sp.]